MAGARCHGSKCCTPGAAANNCGLWLHFEPGQHSNEFEDSGARRNLMQTAISSSETANTPKEYLRLSARAPRMLCHVENAFDAAPL